MSSRAEERARRRAEDRDRRIDEYVQRINDAAPPLTEYQRDVIRRVLAPGPAFPARLTR
jgi:hypothetical protein